MREKILIEPAGNQNLTAKICVVGVGGAGGNAVNNMINRGVENVTFITANTDQQSLGRTLADEKILLGENTTKGLGAGTDPEVGRKATEESVNKLQASLSGFDLIFVTAGMGGGTGTGGSPVIAKVAKETGALVIGVVSKCFTREGSSKTQRAEQGIEELKKNLDAIIVIANDKILEVSPNVRPLEAYNKANDILYNSVRGIIDIIQKDAIIKADMADVKASLSNAGEVIIGVGTSKGENAPQEAVMNALNSPFFDKLKLRNSGLILLNMVYGSNYTMKQINDTVNSLQHIAGDGVDIKIGESEDEASDELCVTILAPAKYNNDFNKSLNSIQTEIPIITNESENVVSNSISNNPLISIELEEPAEVKVVKPRKATPENETVKLNLFEENKEEDIVGDIVFVADVTEEYLLNDDKIKINGNKNHTTESIEIMSGLLVNSSQIKGRPRGDSELKEYDVPA
jgi:cell division protein FtsZ